MIKAFFNENVDEITVHGLTQWDKGQQLEITLSSLPASFEVHFSYRRHDTAYVVQATATDGVAVVAIPNLILQQPYDAIAWLYVTEGDAGETIKTINLPIEARTKPSDYVYTEIEILDYKNLDKRIDTLEKGGASDDVIKDAVNAYLEENPVQAVDLDTTLSESGKAADAKAVGDKIIELENKSGMVDLAKYGIVAADYEPPFTVEHYKVAYQNGVGIQNAINDAIAAGLTEIVIPAGNYPLCYASDSDTTYNAIIDARGMNLRGYGVKLYVIYDEDGNNPYFTGETPRLLQGTVIHTENDVRGFHIVGERKYRVAEETKYREGSSGIGVGRYTDGNLIKDCTCELFSGDGFGCHQYMEQISGWEPDTFTAVTWSESENAFVYSKYLFTSTEHQASWIDLSKPILLRNTGYFLYSSGPLRIVCFDENRNYIGRVNFYQGQYFYFLPNTHYWHIEIPRVVEHAEDATEQWSFWLGHGKYQRTTIEGCISRYNQRGGMSNLPNASVVRNCHIHHNGCAFDGMPAFYDSTQFGIDVEDIYIDEFTVEDCHIDNNLQGLLWRCRKLNVIGTYISGYTASLNSCVDFYAQGSTFDWGISLTTPTPFGNKVAIGCTINGNVPEEIVLMDDVADIPVRAAVDSENSNKLGFYNRKGDMVFDADLTMLGKAKGEAATADGLLFDGDMLAFTADKLTMNDKTGNVSMTARAANITGNGLLSVGGNENAVNAAWNNAPTFGKSAAFEIFFTGGVPYLPWRDAVNTYAGYIFNGGSGGFALPTSASAAAYYNGSAPAYINTSGESVLAKREGGAHGYDEDGNKLELKEENFPDSGLTKYGHVVVNLLEDGTSQEYMNGILGAHVPATVTDFAQWDFSVIAETFRLWSGNNSNFILRAARMYNRALTKDEVRNNFAYEVNRFNGVGGGSDGEYELPVATENTLGGVKPVAKTVEMTQSVGVDADGKLFTEPGSGGGGTEAASWKKVAEIKTTEALTYISVTEDMDGNPLSFDEAIVCAAVARDADATTNSTWAVSPRAEWRSSFNGCSIYNLPLYADVYGVIFMVSKHGDFVKTLCGKARRLVASMAAYTNWASELMGNNINSQADNTTPNATTVLFQHHSNNENAYDHFNADGKLYGVTIGVDTANAVKLGAGSTLEVWVR